MTFERKDEPEVALIIVLDRSWSMAGSSMELCKAAAAGGGRRDDRRAVARRPHVQRSVRLGRHAAQRRQEPRRHQAEDRRDRAGRPHADLSRRRAGVPRARTAKARAKHVVLLSDGRSYPDDYEGLVKKMVDAQHHRVVGRRRARRPTPNCCATSRKWGKGRAYVGRGRARKCRRSSSRRPRTRRRPAFDEKRIKPVVKTPAFLTGVDSRTCPPLKGRTATVMKDTALEVSRPTTAIRCWRSGRSGWAGPRCSRRT